MVTNKKGQILDIIDKKKKDLPLKMKIYTDDEIIEILQNEKLCRIDFVNKANFSEIPFIMPLQSELTSEIVESLLEFGDCGLATINESYILHSEMINAFNKHLFSINKHNSNICPIT